MATGVDARVKRAMNVLGKVNKEMKKFNFQRGFKTEESGDISDI